MQLRIAVVVGEQAAGVREQIIVGSGEGRPVCVTTHPPMNQPQQRDSQRVVIFVGRAEVSDIAFDEADKALRRGIEGPFAQALPSRADMGTVIEVGRRQTAVGKPSEQRVPGQNGIFPVSVCHHIFQSPR